MKDKLLSAKILRTCISKNVLFVLVLAVLMAGGQAVWGSTARAMSLERLVVTSDAVVLGRAGEARTFRESNGRMVTRVTYEVEQYVTGEGPAQISVRLLGGTMDGVTQYVHGEPRLPRGEATLLFLERRPQAAGKIFVISGLSQGAFRVVEDKKTAARFAVRDLDALNLTDPPPVDRLGLARSCMSTFLPLDKLLTLIRKFARDK